MTTKFETEKLKTKVVKDKPEVTSAWGLKNQECKQILD